MFGGNRTITKNQGAISAPQPVLERAQPDSAPILHAKILKDKSGKVIGTLLYASERKQGTGLKDFFFDINARRSERAKQALGDVSTALALGQEHKVRLAVPFGNLHPIPAETDAKTALHFLVTDPYKGARCAFVEKYQCRAEVDFLEAYSEFVQNKFPLDGAQDLCSRFLNRGHLQESDAIDRPARDGLNLDRADEQKVRLKLGEYEQAAAGVRAAEIRLAGAKSALAACDARAVARARMLENSLESASNDVQSAKFALSYARRALNSQPAEAEQAARRAVAVAQEKLKVAQDAEARAKVALATESVFKSIRAVDSAKKNLQAANGMLRDKAEEFVTVLDQRVWPKVGSVLKDHYRRFSEMFSTPKLPSDQNESVQDTSTTHTPLAEAWRFGPGSNGAGQDLFDLDDLLPPGLK